MEISKSNKTLNSFLKTPFNLALNGGERFCLRLAQSLCLSKLNQIKVGNLTIVSQEEKHSFGKPGSDLKATLHVKNQVFWYRIMVFNALGLGEAFMYGDFTCDNVPAFLTILAENRDYLMDGKGFLPAGLNYIANAVFTSRISNSLLNSLGNISAHYDLGNEMFEAFLDNTMTYSCPIWSGEEDEALEDAQMRKIHSMLDRAAIKKGHLVLEIGSGWGALAIEAVRRHDCRVVTITLSKEQQVLAQERIDKAGLSEKITVLLQDYRLMSPEEFQFDRIISVEMIEAVGPEYLSTFFKACDGLLKPSGSLVMQAITMPEARYAAYCKKTDFIQKHIFPGGHCPSFTALVTATMEGAEGRLAVDDVINIGPHYAKALRIWNERFTNTFDSLALASGKPEIYNEEFKRMWQWYFYYCQVGFATRTLGVLQIRFTRPANMSLIENVPF